MTPDDAVPTRLLARPRDLAAAVRVWQLANIARGKVPDENRRARVRTKLTEANALAVVVRRARLLAWRWPNQDAMTMA
jgi:hypothetical protein